MAALLIAAGCGDSAKNAGTAAGGAGNAAGVSSAGSQSSGSTSGGGQSLAGAMSGGSSGTAGASVGGVSQHAACIEYVERYCAFLEGCRGTTEAAACARAGARRCPDVLFSEGSTRTPEGLLQCATVWSTWSCDDFGEGQEPDCVTPGSKAIGEPCVFASQCVSLSCSGNGSACGLCQTSSPPAGPCADGDRCGIAQVCVNGTECRPNEEYNRDGKPGDACSEEQGCNVASYCSKAGMCVVLPETGASCLESARCAGGVPCNYDTYTCKVLPGLNQACSASISEPECAAGAHCEDTVCVADRKEGEPCYLGRCAVGFSCRDATAELPGTCKARGSTPACAGDYDCNDGSVCRDETCKTPVKIGEPCDATRGCPPRSECTNGRCQPGESQGLFAEACR